MKPSDITAGETYQNRSGKCIRKVLRESSNTVTPDQMDTDCIDYLIIEGPGKGSERSMTRLAFGSWAFKRADIGKKKAKAKAGSR